MKRLPWALILFAVVTVVVIATGNFHTKQSTSTTSITTPSVIQQQDCIILASSGNKLCGADASSWCRATDVARVESGGQLDSTCQDLERRYP